MKVSVFQDKLSRGLSSVTRVVSSRPTLPVLSNILIEAKKGRLQLSATDLSMGIKLGIGAKVEREGAITVPAKVFGDLVSSFSPSTISLSASEDSLQLSGLGYKVRLAGIPAKDYPSLGKIDGKEKLNISATDFSEAIERVVLAASTDETRPVLSGVLWSFSDSQLQLVATDGYRLSLVTVGSFIEKSRKKWMLKAKKMIGKGIIIPARALRDVEKLVDEQGVKEVSLSLAKNQNLAVFSIGDAEFTTRLIEGEFPNFAQVIPKEEVGVSLLELEPLTKAVRTAAVFARDSANIVHWKINDKELVISANAPSYGESESRVDITLKGEGGEIAFNNRYLLEYLSVVPTKRISFRMKGGLDPGVFRFTGKHKNQFLHLIMPVRVQK